MSLQSTPSAGKPLANTVSECEANDQSDCNSRHLANLERWSVTAKRHLPYMNLTEIIFAFLRILQKNDGKPPILLRKSVGDMRMRSERAGRACEFLALLAAT
jgi:hypothetical protein